MRLTKTVPFALAVVVCMTSLGDAADQPTTPTWPIPSDWREVLRERMAEYQPLIEQWRKKSSEELKKAQQWEYKVVSVQSSDPEALGSALNQWGAEGWECFHVSSSAPLEPGDLPNKHLLFFRKHKGSWISQIPLRDILRLLMFFTSDSQEPAD